MVSTENNNNKNNNNERTHENSGRFILFLSSYICPSIDNGFPEWNYVLCNQVDVK